MTDKKDKTKETKGGDQRFEMRIEANQRAGLRPVASIRERSKQVAAGPQSKHEDRDHDRCGIHGIPEHVAELPHPDHLVDQAADARAEEQDVKAD